MNPTTPPPTLGSPVLEQQSLVAAASQDKDGNPEVVLVEDSQYQEISTSRTVPTKTGDEDLITETQLEQDRPGTAGTSYSERLNEESPVRSDIESRSVCRR